MTKFYRDVAGNYLGGFDGTTRDVPGVGTVRFDPVIPSGAVEVATPPDHGLQRWNGAAWVDTPALVKARAADNLAATDAAMPEVFEQLWAALKGKGALADADLPQASRDLLAARATERGKL